MAAMERGDAAAVNLGVLLGAGAGAVVTLVAGDTQLLVHTAVLSARSPAFAAMFGRKRHGQVTIADVEGPVLCELVSYMYTLQAPQQPDMVPQLLAAADNYGVRGLKAYCEQQMAAQLTVENAASTAVLAVRHDCPDLRQAAVDFVKAHTHEVMATRGWADAMLDRPKDLLAVSRLLAGVPVELGSTGGTDGQSHNKAPEAAAMPTTSSGGNYSSQTQSGGTQGYSQSNCSTNSEDDEPPRSPSGGNSGCQLWNLSAEEKGRRLIKAAEEGTVNQLKRLLAAGADVRTRDKNNCTALHIAARDGLVGAVKSLLRSGADVDARDRCRFTPLHWAAQNDQVDVVRVLVEASADLDARDKYGGTPLHTAAYFGNEGAAAALVQAGADLEARNNCRKLPLDLARNSGNGDLVEMLYCYSYDRY